MVNKWVEHVRSFAKSHNIAYGCAISNPECKNSYHKIAPQKPASIDNTEIRDLENKLKEKRDGYYATHLRDVMRKGLGVNRRSKPAVGHSSADYSKSYNTLKNELEKKTGKKYETLISSEQLRKDNAKAEKIRRKEELNKPEPIPGPQMGVSYPPFKLGYKTRKTSA